MKNAFVPGIVLALSLASCAMLSSFGRADANDDGRISRDEAAPSPELSAAFGSADTDQDGYLDPAEFEHARELIRAWDEPRHDTHDAGGGHKH